MNALQTSSKEQAIRNSGELSAAARGRILGVRGEPLFYADWLRVVFIHYEVDAWALQRVVPFELELHDGRAYVSLVAFTMRGMRPRRGGRLGEFLFKPIATHGFLNVRAYVRHEGEPGIYFLAEWLPNFLSVHMGPRAFGLPYRLAKLDYRHNHECGCLEGLVTDGDGSGRLEYGAEIEPATAFAACEAGSLDEFLLERYTAFTERGSRRRLFRIWHPAWAQRRIEIAVADSSLLTETWPWFAGARLAGANYSPGFEEVWMGRPLRCV